MRWEGRCTNVTEERERDWPCGETERERERETESSMGGGKSNTSAVPMKRVRLNSWEQAEGLCYSWTRHWTQESGVYLFIHERCVYKSGVKRVTLLLVGHPMRKDEEPNLQRPVELLLRVRDPAPGAGEEQEGGSGVPSDPAGGPGLHHRVRAHTLHLLLSTVRAAEKDLILVTMPHMYQCAWNAEEVTFHSDPAHSNKLSLLTGILESGRTRDCATHQVQVMPQKNRCK